MVKISEQRHQMIKSAILPFPEKVVDVSIPLWEKLSVSLGSVIGEEGFNSLLTRSAYLNKTHYSWLVLEHDGLQSESPFAGIKLSLEARAKIYPDDACHGSVSLLNTFVELLALLIGEHLTSSILRTAWEEEIRSQLNSKQHATIETIAEKAIKDNQP